MRKAGAPTEFTAYGYTFQLMKEERHICLYKQQKNNRVYAYEVHKMRQEGALGLPQPKSKFGSSAWSYQHRENAEKKFHELTKRGVV